MFYISHRGNISGSIESFENDPQYINMALRLGYDVEIDVRVGDFGLYLGHDSPQYKVEIDFLRNEKLWLHAKDIRTLGFLLSNVGQRSSIFFHQRDDCTLTNNGYIWTFPGKPLTSSSICVLPLAYPEVCCAGICSDNIISFKK